ATDEPRGASAWRASPRGARPVLEDVAPGRAQVTVDLDLPKPAGEGGPRLEIAHVRLHALARGHADDQLGIRLARTSGVHVAWEAAAEARVHVVDREPHVGVAEDLHGARAPHRQRLAHPPTELDQLVVARHGALYRLAAARFEHGAGHRVQA